MRNILLYGILLCLFLVNIAEAGIRWTPPTEYLPPEELDPLLRAWDRAMSSSDFYVRDRQLPSIMGRISNGERFSGAFYCLFSNPEIIDRVVQLYRREAERELAGQLPPTEGSAEYLMALAEVAESTFDPRLYEDILHVKIRFSGAFRGIYLATVYPERTLEVLLESERGDKAAWANEGRGGHPRYLYHREKIGLQMPVVGACAILSYMTVESPHALRAEQERIIGFVTNFSRHFAEPIKMDSRPPMYFDIHDYFVRSDALDVLELVGTVTEVPLVEKIIHDAKEAHFSGGGRRLDTYLDRGYEQIQDKGQRIIEELRRRSPSQR